MQHLAVEVLEHLQRREPLVQNPFRRSRTVARPNLSTRLDTWRNMKVEGREAGVRNDVQARCADRTRTPAERETAYNDSHEPPTRPLYLHVAPAVYSGGQVLRLPIGLHDALDETPPPGWTRDSARAHYYAVLRSLLELDYKSRKRGWRALNSTMLRRLYGSSHVDGAAVYFGPALVKHLVDLKVLVCNNRYSKVRHYSRKYRVTDRWFGRPRETMHLGPELVYTFPPQAIRLDTSPDPALDYLGECLGRLVCDLGSAYAAAADADVTVPLDYLSATKHVMRRREVIGTAGVRKRQSHVNAVQRVLDHGDTWCYRDGTSGRVHTHVINLPSEVRPHIGFEGEPSVTMIDVRNSQLLLPCALLNLDLPGAWAWVEMAHSGEAYEAAYRAIYGCELRTSKQRSEFKKEFFGEVWYSALYKTLTSNAGRAVAKHWPAMHELLLDLKERDYKDFPIAMQRLESALVADMVVLYLRDRGVPLVTVHDCVMVPTRHADTAVEAIAWAFGTVGLEPGLNTTTWATPFAL